MAIVHLYVKLSINVKSASSVRENLLVALHIRPQGSASHKTPFNSANLFHICFQEKFKSIDRP